TKTLGKITEELARVEKKLANKNFMDKAPPEVVEKERGKVAELTEKIEKINGALERVRSLG
ncbi:MAG: hypothetical protein V3T30_06335, partial [Thermodesulfobacteriota bacterium]